MIFPSRSVMVGITLGALSATALSTLSPGFVMRAFAAEPVGADLSRLMKFDERFFSVDYADSVSTAAIGETQVVSKISGGHPTTVRITTTSTGTYSEDAMVSPHVRYPGVRVRELFAPPEGVYVALWSDGRWTVAPLLQSNSFVDLEDVGPFGN